MTTKKLLFTFLLSGLQILLFAQVKPTNPKPYKPPVLTTALGSLTGKAFASKEEVLNIIGLPILITDSKKTSYKISSYQLLYREKTQIEDDKTGEVKSSSDMVSKLFKESPLPEVWIRNIKERLKPGEELYFFDVIVKDSQGRPLYAPDLSITIK